MWKATEGLIQQTHAAFFGAFRQQQGRAAVSSSMQQERAAAAAANDGNGTTNTNDHDSNHEEKMVARHKESTARNDTVMSEAEHLLHQKRVFDEMSDFFATKQTIPDELLPVYRHLAGQIWDSTRRPHEDKNGDTPVRILDVACGSGALFSFLMEQQKTNTGAASTSRLEITGVDLSPQMVAAAQKQAQTLLSSELSDNSDMIKIQVVESDILQYHHAKSNDDVFDVIVVNACFGNFWNPTVVLEHLANNLLAAKGSVVISHPLGAAFVGRLHDEDPLTVPHLLPTTLDEWRALLPKTEQQVPLLQCTTLDLTFRDAPYYFARLERESNNN